MRERGEDLSHLVQVLLVELARKKGRVTPTLSPEALALLRRYHWPGNIRELVNTLTRAAIWSTAPRIDAKDVEEALLVPPATNHPDSMLEQPLGDDFNLKNLLSEIKNLFLTGNRRNLI